MIEMMWQIWVFGGALLAPVSLWYAQNGWRRADDLSFGDGSAPRATDGEVIFGYMAVTFMGLFFLGLLVPIFFVALRKLKIEPEIKRLEANGSLLYEEEELLSRPRLPGGP